MTSSNGTVAATVERVHASHIDDLPIAVLRFETGELVSANRRWSALTGLDPDASRGSGWLAAVHSDDWATARQFTETASRTDTIA
ncbi:MAG TPA: hypothetical protein VGZ52_04400, partial [Acidimicrobiales bacterium]|nr:hypothetical protein [Acidimicrobiales bacterium]